MSVFRRMLGRELPCGLGEILGISGHCKAASTEGSGTRELYESALSCIATGKFGLARGQLKQVIDLRPGFAAARLALAAVYEEIAEHYQAAMQIEAVLANPSQAGGETSHAALLIAAAFAWERSGHWRLAATRYRDALAESPGNLHAYHRLIAIELAHGRLDAAAKHLRSLLNHSPADQSARVTLAHLLQRRKCYKEAAWEYEQALCLEPDSWELPVHIARRLHLIGTTAEAIRMLERLVGAQPHFPDLRMRLANLYSLEGQDAAARAEFEQALSYHPDYLDCHISLARHELRMGRLEEASRHYRCAIAINNQHVEIYVGLALALQRSAHRAQASEILSSASRIANNSALLIALLGSLECKSATDMVAYGGLGKASNSYNVEISAESVEELLAKDRKALARHPRWNDVRVRMAIMLRLLGRAWEAGNLLKPVVSEEPEYRQAWMQLGLVHLDQRAPRKASVAFASAIDPNPKSLEPEYRLGLIYCGTTEFEVAVDAAEQLDDGEDMLRRVWVVIDGMRMNWRKVNTAQADDQTDEEALSRE